MCNIHIITHFTFIKLFTSPHFITEKTDRDEETQQEITLCYIDLSEVFVFIFSLQFQAKLPTASNSAF